MSSIHTSSLSLSVARPGDGSLPVLIEDDELIVVAKLSEIHSGLETQVIVIKIQLMMMVMRLNLEFFSDLFFKWQCRAKKKNIIRCLMLGKDLDPDLKIMA